jgi:NAD(P)-dependent dehydrogenase (short-subunit alcohol dehydrogenase family)
MMTEYKATILITGGSSGLGKATAQQLALSQPNRQIVITGRSPRGVADELNTLTGKSNVTFLKLDLTTKAGARDFAKRFLEAGFPPIETFYYNAALQFVDKIHINEDGIEETFAVNHLNQTLALLSLKDQLTEDARIIIVGSAVHHPEYSYFKLKAIWSTTEEVARPTKADEGSAWDEGMRRYGLSKAANMIFMHALADQITRQGKKWTVSALDPGVMPTNLFRHLGSLIQPIFTWSMDTWIGRWYMPEVLPTFKVAEQMVRMGYDRSWQGEGVHGVYFGTGGQLVESSEAPTNEANKKELWDWTIKELEQGQQEKFGQL